MSPVLKGTMEIRVKVSEPPASAGGQKDGATPTPGTQAPSPASPQRGEIPPIILDWRRIKGHEEKSTVSNVRVNGKAVSVSANWPPANAGGSDKNVPPAGGADFSEHLIFREGIVAGENVIKLDFTSPILSSGSAITRYVDKEDGSEYIYSLFVPSDASTAFPVFDQPDLKARFALSVTSPKDWKVVLNTAGESYIEHVFAIQMEGQPFTGGTFFGTKFPETKPISTYVFAFAAGPWEKVSAAGGGGSNLSGSEGAPPSKAPTGTLPTGRVTASGATQNVRADLKEVYKKWLATDCCGIMSSAEEKTFKGQNVELQTNIFIRKSQAAKFKPHAAEVFRLNREAVKYFEQYFDYKFPFPKYDLVLIPEFPFGGMEHAGATFLRESSIIFPQEPTRNDLVSRATLIFHEAAHQWFGDTVTMRWFDDLWLKEGFATFTAYKALEKIMPEMNSWKVFLRTHQTGRLPDRLHPRHHPHLPAHRESKRGKERLRQHRLQQSPGVSAAGRVLSRRGQVPNGRAGVFEEA
jgi:hypothetical protein